RRMYVLIMLCMPMLFHFAMVILRADVRHRVQIRTHWIIGFVVALFSLGSPWIIEGTQRYSWGYEPTFGILGYGTVLWIGVMMIAAGLEAVKAWQQSQPGTLERRRVTIFCAAMGVLYLAFVDFMSCMGIEIYPMAFAPITAFTL